MTSIRRVASATVCSVIVIIAIVVSNNKIRTTEQGLVIIGSAESCRREPYTCPAGLLTDGVGNTYGVKSGTRKSDKEIARDWQRNILEAEKCINTYFNGREMSDNAFSAMTSAAFNMGCYNLRFYKNSDGEYRQTSIHKHANSGSWLQMCNHLPDFANSRGTKLPGLVVRREQERVLCLTK
ncbi:lysozyme [Yersinia enterocolitica]|uniref:lysozyme n=1 Tax=Yersinia enterocolitica TaxID=630 RepID=UPI00155A56D4|nr:lysozyme [Yersinia enterocolitica]NQS96718.1 lysozyme [Yersinia enterocolitica]NQT43395.1 lysozyme [Yersinia enterocolitica]NQT98805.1 lysozyme [Yersinia enterocolitica]HDM8448671.1 lysozyme [Yersinia enterocolitica]